MVNVIYRCSLLHLIREGLRCFKSGVFEAALFLDGFIPDTVVVKTVPFFQQYSMLTKPFTLPFHINRDTCPPAVEVLPYSHVLKAQYAVCVHREFTMETLDNN